VPYLKTNFYGSTEKQHLHYAVPYSYNISRSQACLHGCEIEQHPHTPATLPSLSIGGDTLAYCQWGDLPTTFMTYLVTRCLCLPVGGRLSSVAPHHPYLGPACDTPTSDGPYLQSDLSTMPIPEPSEASGRKAGPGRAWRISAFIRASVAPHCLYKRAVNAALFTALLAAAQKAATK